MADLTIKAQAGSSNKLILQDQAGGAVLTTADSGATLGNSTQDNITRLGTVTSGTLASTTTFPAGHIISVSYVQPTSGGNSTNANSFMDCPGVTLTKTPASSSSKFLIFYILHFYIDSHADNAWKKAFWAVHRSISGGASGLVHTPYTDDSSYMFGNFWEDNSDRMMAFQSGQWLDSPNTTSAVTYKCQFKSTAAGYTVYNNSAYGLSSMTLMEIAS